MGLLERALLIKEIDQSFQTMAEEKASFNDRVKAEFHLKEIRENDQYDIHAPKSNHITTLAAEQVANYFAKTSLFHSSYRGFFFVENQLLEVLGQTPEMGWALISNDQEQWQAWLIIRPEKPPAHSSWKDNLEETMQWIQQQQKLFKCLNEDATPANDAIPLAEIQSQPHATYVQALIEKPVRTVQNIQLDEYHAEIHPIEYIPAFSDQLYQLKFQDINPSIDFAEFLYLKTSNQSIVHSPIYIAEQVDQQGKFIRYLVLFGTSNIEQTINLMDAFSDHNQLWLSAIKSCNWLLFKEKFRKFESLFECFIEQTQAIWRQDKKGHNYIPTPVIKTHKMIMFEEAPANLRTPLILLNDNQKYRVIHGNARLSLKPTELAYPFVVFTRSDQMNWQLIQTIINTLPSPITAEALNISLENVLLASKSN